MKQWYTRYGFDDNPLGEDVGEAGLIEYQDLLDELTYRIESGAMAFIEGPEGMGKSALLAKAIERFGGKGKVIYYDCTQIKKKDAIDELMKGRYGLAGKLFGVVPKDMIVLLDNVNALSRENAERIKYYFDQNNIRSVIFSGESLAKAQLPQSIKDRIGMHVIKLRPLSEYGAIELVGARLGEQSALISDEAIKYIFSKANRNTGKLLALTDKVFSALLPRAAGISLDDAKKVLRND